MKKLNWLILLLFSTNFSCGDNNVQGNYQQIPQPIVVNQPLIQNNPVQQQQQQFKAPDQNELNKFEIPQNSSEIEVEKETSVSENSKEVDELISKSKEIDQETEKVTLETEVQDTGIDWKVYNPIQKVKKYIYSFTSKEGDITASSDIEREVTKIAKEAYLRKQTILSSGKDENAKLRAIETIIPINSDNSPSIVPIVSVGGEKVEETSKIEVFDKPVKIKVPYGTLDAIKITSKKDNVLTTEYYSKNIGLIKSEQKLGSLTYTLELKEIN